VNTASGSVTLVNNTLAAISIQGYEVTSSAGSLDMTAGGWQSLADQNVDPVLGGDGVGETWQEGGHPSAHELLEGFLLGSTTLDPGESLSLGRAYDASIDARDLTFNYRLAGQTGVVTGIVAYDHAPPQLPGDYDNDFDVDGADLLAWQRAFGGSAPLPNDQTPGSVTAEDLNVWKANFGVAASSATAQPSVAVVPEPSPATMIVLLTPAMIALSSRRRLKASRRALSALGLTLGLAAVATAQSPPAPYGVVPTERQLDWHRQEFYAFLHFGHNTFTNEEWGWSQSTPDVFNPTALDADQWAQSFVDAGMTGMILTAKHHDGMALWDTSTTEYKIANGAWAQNRVAQGLDANVVRMAAESAKSHGLKFGIYLSPWDMHRDPAVSKNHLAGTIYDEPQIFGDSTPGDYNDFYAAQLTELVTMQLSDGSPIELSEVWLDGASGSSTVQTFDWTRFRDVIREHQPDAVMWGHQGVDARWVGNEEGVTAATNWHTISRTQDQARYSESQLEVGVRDGLYWTPAEADARLRSGWFYHENENPKSADALLQMYLHSVGRSVNLLLDVPPNQQGKIVLEDVTALNQFRQLRDDFLDRELTSSQSTVTASSVRGGNNALFGPANVVDGDADTYWTMNDGQTAGSFEIDLGGLRLINAFVVQEHIALGQRIGGYAIDAWINDAFQTVVNGTSLGYQRIDSLATPVETSRIRFRVTQANAVPLISSFQALGDVIFGATGDLDLNGLVDLADWQLFIAGVGADLSGLSPLEAFQMGDMNGDGRNGLQDLDLFIAAYDGAHGAGGFAAALQTLVPEPASRSIALTLALALAFGSSSRRRASWPQARRRPAVSR
jgi:alpha-L-fucosidase